jgi:nitrate reductase assembly molybdenum cofactor insertion protein NarJ
MSETVAITDPRVQELLAEASAWRLLGLLIERPREGWREDVEALSRVVSDAGIRTAADAAREDATEGLHLAFLGPGGPVSPREVTYRGMEDPGHIIADISAFYEAFAFQPETEEAPDHLSVETGFLGYLCVKEAYARTRGNEEEAEIAANAAARFREAHLSPLAWSVAERLQATNVRYLSLAATALARRTGPRRDTETAAKAPLRLCDDCPMECGQE